MYPAERSDLAGINRLRAPPAGRQQGFVMLAVIWVLLAMLAGVALFSHWVQVSLQHAHARQGAINAHIGARTAMNTALYIRLTGQRSVYGVSVPSEAGVEQDILSLFEFDDLGALMVDHGKASQNENLALDQQVWQYGGLNFVVQDTAGLIGLTDFSHQAVVRHLLRHGRTHLRAQQLIDSYLDYRDADNQRRLSGAEAFDYRLQERAEPLNGALRNPLQLRDVIHWDQVLEPWSNGDLLYRLKVSGGASVNVNSASPEVLEWILDDAALARQIFERRRTEPYTNVFALEALIDDETIALTIEPDEGLRFWWWEQSSPSAWVHEFHYDAIKPGRAALIQDWAIRVDVPQSLKRQSPREVKWRLLPEFPDYLGRRRTD